MSSIITMTDKTQIVALLQIDADGTVSAKKLYEFLELEPKNYARWSRENILENQFAEEGLIMGFSSLKKKTKKAADPSPTIDYPLNLLRNYV